MTAFGHDDDGSDWAEVGAAIVTDIKAALSRRDVKITDLEARVARLQAAVEAIGELKYCGIWKADREYVRGNFTTVSGSLWHCEEKTRSRPGTDATWRLAVKQGTCTLQTK